MLEEPTRLREPAPDYLFLVLIACLWLHHTVDLRRQKSSFIKSCNRRDDGLPIVAHWVARKLNRPTVCVGHALDVFNPDQSGFAAGIDDLLCKPLKPLVMDRLVRKHIGGGFELNSAKLLEPPPNLYPPTGLLCG